MSPKDVAERVLLAMARGDIPPIAARVSACKELLRIVRWGDDAPAGKIDPDTWDVILGGKA
jgi:hypothetical protein